MTAYAFPSISLLYKVIEKIHREQSGGHSNSAFLAEANLVSDDDVTVNRPSFTTSGRPGHAEDGGKAKVCFHNVPHPRSTAWKLSRDNTKRQDFLRNLPNWQQKKKFYTQNFFFVPTLLWLVRWETDWSVSCLYTRNSRFPWKPFYTRASSCYNKWM